MAGRNVWRKRFANRVVLGGISLVVAGGVATALLVGVFVGIGWGVGQRVVGVIPTPTHSPLAALQPIATPTASFPYSPTVTQTATVHPRSHARR